MKAPCMWKYTSVSLPKHCEVNESHNTICGLSVFRIARNDDAQWRVQVL
jgi:hypothetical protein